VKRFKIGKRWVGDTDPTYFIADISANHDGQLKRAKELIRLAKESGADAAKFQHFRAEYIVSDRGFCALGRQRSHQAKWKKSVFEVYQAASLPWEWTAELCAYSRKVGIDFFSAPYDLEAVDMLDPYVLAYKIGSGDISWPEIIKKIGSKRKPVILATGASTLGDVDRAMKILRHARVPIGLLQCNTNYTGSLDNFNHIHLNVLKTYLKRYPDAVLGLSDHTPGHAAVLGAVALGGRIVEKHFTDDTSRVGPDHPFSMTPTTWEEMVLRTRELERALGSEKKDVARNESETVILQRRCIRAAKPLKAGTLLQREHLSVLRPAPRNGIFPYEMDQVLGRRLRSDLNFGDHLRWSDL
jgi:N-acetylneuraminate synthase